MSDGNPLLDDTSALAYRLLRRLQEIGPVAVAYAGCTDSALVLAAAVRALGPARVLAVTAVLPPTGELGRPDRRVGGYGDRCYFCKSEVLDAITALARHQGFENVATGTNADDALDPHRPGLRAGSERRVHTPLLDTGVSKADVRRLSLHWSLPTWNKPATPCLAGRIR